MLLSLGDQFSKAPSGLWNLFIHGLIFHPASSQSGHGTQSLTEPLSFFSSSFGVPAQLLCRSVNLINLVAQLVYDHVVKLPPYILPSAAPRCSFMFAAILFHYPDISAFDLAPTLPCSLAIVKLCTNVAS